MTYARLLLSGAAGAALVTTGVLAQDFAGDPEFGVVTFDGSEKAAAQVRAGGAMSASGLGAGCAGFITEAPALIVDHAGGPVFFAAGGDADLTLTVRTPAGAIVCNDDGAGDLNPGVSLTAAPSGRYELWVGTFAAGVGRPDAMVNITADGFDASNPFAADPDPALPAPLRLSLEAGFSGDPRRADIEAGGPARLERLDPDCYGRAAAAPAAALDYTAGSASLYLSVEGDARLVLAVRTPDGVVVCDNDSAGDLNRGVMFETPQSGEYQIWAGVFHGEHAENQPAVLLISETGFDGVDHTLTPDAAPAYGRLTLAAGFSPDPERVDVEAGGPIKAELAIEDNTWCSGAITAAPTLAIDYAAGADQLVISATSGGDATLAVRDPDGDWRCDDDSGAGFNPAVTFETPESGEYLVYAGMLFEDLAPATLFISAVGAGPDPQNSWADPSAEPLFGRQVLAAGEAARIEAEVEAGGPLEADIARSPNDDAYETYCAGMITAAPTVLIENAGDGAPLTIEVDAELDATLAVHGPDGAWICDDDGGVGLNPAIMLEAATAGDYAVYVGAFRAETGSASLTVSRQPAARD